MRLPFSFSRFLSPQPRAFPLAPGLYAYRYESDGEKSHLHLRVDAQGNGTLLVNASRIYHFNPTAALMAWAILEGKSEKEQVDLLTATYAVTRHRAARDLATFRQTLAQLIRPDGACPFHELELEPLMPFSDRPHAPYRMDLAITYRCNNECAHCYNARARNYPELPTEDWRRILDTVRAIGVPHVVFTGGEATLRDDLPELIAYAAQLGLITGLNTNARRLADERYVRRLVEAGLDHVQITVESCDAEVHNRMVGARAFDQTIRGLKNALASPLFVMTNTTLLRENAQTVAQTIDFLAELGVPTIGMNALIYAGHGLKVGTGLAEAELQPLLEIARQKTQEYGQRLIWYTPTQYCHFDPMQLELGVKGCTAALYSMCIESTGDVLPCQSYYYPVGNILRDPWEAIWNHPLCVRLRERTHAPQACQSCPLLPQCGGGCPLKWEVRPEAGLMSPTQARFISIQQLAVFQSPPPQPQPAHIESQL
ncbi:MAG: PqqD family peptide modification chaperone [Anaerolineales bacterium]